MIGLVVVSGLGLLCLPTLIRPLGRRLRPDWWAALCLAALAAGSALVLFGGVATSISTVFRAIGLPTVARACDAMLGHLVPAGSPLAMLVILVTGSVLILASRSLLRTRRIVRKGWVEPGIGLRLRRHGEIEVIALDTEHPRAFSVPRSRSRAAQIVVTRGLVEALSPEEFHLVCAHEASHLHFGHSRWLAFVSALERGLWFFPPTRLSCAALRLALERWADESAAGEAPERRARLGDALVAMATDHRRPVLAAFSSLDGLVERLTAMSEPAGATLRTTWWPALVVPGLLLGGVAVVALAHLGHGAFCLLSMPHSCSLR